ncbi:MAG: hypothetical protein M1549_00885 [Candidatus Dependentiae bacterium]|nr:hypothetical protein [Candidatus Dependentiae bacterium]
MKRAAYLFVALLMQTGTIFSMEKEEEKSLSPFGKKKAWGIANFFYPPTLQSPQANRPLTAKKLFSPLPDDKETKRTIIEKILCTGQISIDEIDLLDGAALEAVWLLKAATDEYWETKKTTNRDWPSFQSKLCDIPFTKRLTLLTLISRADLPALFESEVILSLCAAVKKNNALYDRYVKKFAQYPGMLYEPIWKPEKSVKKNNAIVESIPETEWYSWLKGTDANTPRRLKTGACTIVCQWKKIINLANIGFGSSASKKDEEVKHDLNFTIYDKKGSEITSISCSDTCFAIDRSGFVAISHWDDRPSLCKDPEAAMKEELEPQTIVAVFVDFLTGEVKKFTRVLEYGYKYQRVWLRGDTVIICWGKEIECIHRLTGTRIQLTTKYPIISVALSKACDKVFIEKKKPVSFLKRILMPKATVPDPSICCFSIQEKTLSLADLLKRMVPTQEEPLDEKSCGTKKQASSALQEYDLDA